MYEPYSLKLTEDDCTNEGIVLFSMGNECDYYTNNAKCFEPLGAYFTDVYTKVSDTHDGVDRYSMVMLNSVDDEISIEGGTTYYSGNYDSWNSIYSNYYIQASSNDNIIVYESVSTVIPNYEQGEVYKWSDSEYDYDVVPSPPTNWDVSYGDYYKISKDYYKISEGHEEIHPLSPQYRKWEDGKATYYIRDTSMRIPANMEYQLREDDHLTFFWRDSDDDSAPYQFKHYTYNTNGDGLPTIIRANFTINATTATDAKIKVDNTWPKSGTIEYGGMIGDTNVYKTIYGSLYGDYDLSGSKTIEIRKVNSVQLDHDKNRYYYVITPQPQADKEEFVLTLDYHRHNGNKHEYRHILTSDEYFIYTNVDKSLFEVLGEGTLIQFFTSEAPSEESTEEPTEEPTEELSEAPSEEPSEEPSEAPPKYSPIEIRNKAVNPQTISYRGIDAFSEYCLEVGRNDSFTLIEQQIYSFTNEDNVQFILNENYWDDAKNKYPVFSSGTLTSVRNYDIAYVASSSDSKTFTKLPAINIDSNFADYGWVGTAYLNLSMDKDKPQKILCNTSDEFSTQKIIIWKDKDEGEFFYDSSETDTDDIYVMSNITLDKVGGSLIDVTFVDLAGNRQPIDVFVYKMNSSFETDNWTHDAEGKVTLNIKPNTRTYTDDDAEPDAETNADPVEIDNIQLMSSHKYILPFTITDEITSLKISCSNHDGDVEEIACKCHGETIFEGKDKHFLEIPNDTEKIIINYNNSNDRNVAVVFDNLFKYKDRKIFSENSAKYGITTDTLEDNIRNMDVPKMFNYTHIPSDDIRIDDPLEPTSMFNSNHVYNRFTLPRAELRRFEPYDASIVFVNNR